MRRNTVRHSKAAASCHMAVLANDSCTSRRNALWLWCAMK